jgi:uncharacterized membrane protein YdjX (TVP38/TMEM64 family)
VGVDTIGDLVAWLRSAGASGVVVYALVYVAAAVCLLPGSILMIGAGVAYGPIWGTLIASPAVAAWAARDPRFAAVDAAVGDQGLKLVILVRLSPLIPFNVLNYALGLTRVRTRDVALGSLIGMLPVTFLYVSAGSLAGDLATATGGVAEGPGRSILSAAGLAATLAVTLYLTHVARRALDAAGRRPCQCSSRTSVVAPAAIAVASGTSERPPSSSVST